MTHLKYLDHAQGAEWTPMVMYRDDCLIQEVRLAVSRILQLLVRHGAVHLLFARCFLRICSCSNKGVIVPDWNVR